MNLTEELRHYVEDADAPVAIAGQDRLSQIAPLLGATKLQKILVATYSDYLSIPNPYPLPDFLLARSEKSKSENLIAWKDALAAGLQPGEHRAGPEDLAVMPYTSGTTGKPKGCMHTHHNVQSTAFVYLLWRGASDGGTVTLSALPMFHVTGMQAGMNGPLYKGSTIVVMSRWDRDCAGMLIERARVAGLLAATAGLVVFQLATP